MIGISLFLAAPFLWRPVEAQQSAEIDLAAAQAALSASQPTYRMSGGDELEIRVFNLPELTQIVTVRPEGHISLLFVDDLKVEGMTIPELAAKLEELYGKHFRSPRVAVVPRTFANRNVYVGGEVNQPGVVPLQTAPTLLGSIFRTGGFKDTADLRSVLVMRMGTKGQPERVEVNLEEIVKGTQPDLPLQALDVIYLRKSTINVYVGGEVEKPGMVVLMGKTTLASAVFQAGGMKSSARMKEVILLRDAGGQPTFRKVDLHGILSKGQADVPLQPFDVVFLPKSKITRVNQFVENYIRNILPVQFGFSYLLGAQVF